MPTPSQPLPSSEQKPKPIFDKCYTYRLRRHHRDGIPSFSGLWELTRLDKKGNVEKELSDADGLPYCLDHLQGDLEADGL